MRNIIFVGMSRNYKFHNPEGTNFFSFAVVDWIDVYNGARDYSGEKGILKNVIVVK